jgi:acetyl-CoA acetyltransferase
VERIAIIGLGMLTGPQPGRTARMLEAEATRLAIEDAGLRRDEINGAVQMRRSGGSGERAVLTDAYPRLLGLPVNFYYTIGRGGCLAGLAIPQAWAMLELGIADYVVLTGAVDDSSRAKAARSSGIRGMARTVAKEGYWGKPFGDLRAVSHHSFFAARHMAEYGTTSEQLGAIAVAQRQWANLNPDAKFYDKKMTIEDHQNSPMYVEPYHLLDICQISDGAVSVVLTRADRAQDRPHQPVWVLGAGLGEAMAHLWWDKRNFSELAVAPARDAAFGHAGITLDDIDLAQLYDCFTGEVLFQLEDYGWAKKGEGGAFVAEGNTAPGGSTPINTGGGLLSAHHLGDLTGLAENVIQLRGDAGARQVKDAKIGFFTGHGGEALSPGMCSIHSTTVLGVE